MQPAAEGLHQQGLRTFCLLVTRNEWCRSILAACFKPKLQVPYDEQEPKVSRDSFSFSVRHSQLREESRLQYQTGVELLMS